MERWDLSDCVRCGACRAVCPTFSVIRREYACGRGKVSLWEAHREGEVGLSEGFVRAVTECLTCAACRENCPNGVDVPSLVLEARAEVVKGRGLSLSKSILGRFLSSPTMASIGVKAASILKGFLFREEGTGVHLRLPLSHLSERLLPAPSGTFLKRVRDYEAEGSPRVGLFTGCLINHFLPEIGEATVDLLKRAGAGVVIPRDQVCCGMPFLGMGERERARELVLRNVEVFERAGVDLVVTPCATCATALKIHSRELVDTPEAKTFASRAREVTELLRRDLGVKVSGNGPGRRVTYHDPCHMSRYQHIKDEPRELIEMAGHNLVEMSHPCRCCGLGGTFTIDYPELSATIGRQKAEDIMGTEAEVVATACPGCIIQIRDSLHRLGGKKEVLHVVQLLP